MMRWAGAAILFFLVVASADVRAQQPATDRTFVFDSYMTPLAGARTLLSTQQLIAVVEDRWVPAKLGRERRRTTLALGILYRSAKFIGVDLPQDHFLMVAAHEVFGHGARFRELGDGRIGYGFDAPLPYGPGEAFTSFNGEFPVSPLASLSVSASGMEAQHALADAIAGSAASRGRIHYREAWLYFESRLTAMTYILSASPHSEEGHDVADYLETFQRACVGTCAPSSRRDIQAHALAALVDPMLYYSLYGLAGSYIGAGRLMSPIPLIPLGSQTRVLPYVGFMLAPYGTEWIVRSTFAPTARAGTLARKLGALTLRVGSTGASTTWGFGVRATDVARMRGTRMDAAVELWRQPPILADTTAASLTTGAGATATVVLPLPRSLRSPWSRGLHITAGYKRRGYIPGEQLLGGLILRAGLQTR